MRSKLPLGLKWKVTTLIENWLSILKTLLQTLVIHIFITKTRPQLVREWFPNYSRRTLHQTLLYQATSFTGYIWTQCFALSNVLHTLNKCYLFWTNWYARLSLSFTKCKKSQWSGVKRGKFYMSWRNVTFFLHLMAIQLASEKLLISKSTLLDLWRSQEKIEAPGEPLCMSEAWWCRGKAP